MTIWEEFEFIYVVFTGGAVLPEDGDCDMMDVSRKGEKNEDKKFGRKRYFGTEKNYKRRKSISWNVQ